MRLNSEMILGICKGFEKNQRVSSLPLCEPDSCLPVSFWALIHDAESVWARDFAADVPCWTPSRGCAYWGILLAAVPCYSMVKMEGILTIHPNIPKIISKYIKLY